MESQGVAEVVLEGSGLSTAEQNVVVRSESAEIRIPAGAFEEEIEVTITEGEMDPSQVEGEVVSKTVILGFPGPHMAGTPLTLSLKAIDETTTGQATPNDDGTSRVVLAMVKVEGKAFPAGEVNREAWFPVMTRWDGATGAYLLNLFATAEKISVVLVVRDDAIVHIEPLQESRLNKLKNLFVPALSFAQGTEPPNAEQAATTWGQRRWQVVCSNFNSDTDGVKICDFKEGLPGYQLVKALESATREFAGKMGFRAHVQPSIYIGETVNSAIVTERRGVCGNGALACYMMETGQVIFLQHAFDGEIPIPTTAAHELFHAVENAEGLYARLDNPNCDDWVTEGLADFMGNLQAGVNLITNQPDYRPRNWKIHLNSEEGNDEYRAAEFWAMIGDNDSSYVKKLIQRMGTEGCYGGADKALQEALGISLADAFLNAMVKYRSQNPDYGYCSLKQVSVGWDIPQSFVEGNLWSMSGQCFNFTPPPLPEEGGDFDSLTISAQVFADPGQQFALVVDGLSIPLGGNQKGTISQLDRLNNYKVWVLNLTTLDPYDSKTFEIEATFKLKAEEEEKEEEEAAEEEKTTEDEKAAEVEVGQGGEEESGELPPCQEIWPRKLDGSPMGICLNCCPGAYNRLIEIINAEREAEKERRRIEREEEFEKQGGVVR